jgi:TRAP-type uncharacterized transport system substrate-binding protein
MDMDHPKRAVNVPTTNLKAAAGGAGGSWYVLMEGLARLVTEIYPQLHIEVVEGGGVANHARVGAGELPMGILNPPMTAAAIAGRGPYDQAYPALRVGVANLTVNYLHCFGEQTLPLQAERVRQMHPAAQYFDPGTARLQSQGPLHPGAARYFRAKGRIPS